MPTPVRAHCWNCHVTRKATDMPPALPAAGSPLPVLSTQLIIFGLVISLLAIPQVRLGIMSVVDQVREFFYGPDMPETATSPADDQQSGDGDARADGSRREVDDFDLNIFDRK